MITILRIIGNACMKMACRCKPRNDATSKKRAAASNKKQQDASKETKIELLCGAVIEGKNFIQQIESNGRPATLTM